MVRVIIALGYVCMQANNKYGPPRKASFTQENICILADALNMFLKTTEQHFETTYAKCDVSLVYTYVFIVPAVQETSSFLCL